MRVIGNTLAARLLLVALLDNEVPCTWYANAADYFTPGPLALLPGPTLSLAQHSCALWRQLNAPRALVVPSAFYDLATTAGRVEKLQNEALLDALAGSAAKYTTTLPRGIQPRLVMGARWLEDWPQIMRGAPAVLDQFLAGHGVMPAPLPAEPDAAWLSEAPTTLTDMALASQLLPQLGLLPLRVHWLEWALPEPLPAPEAPLMLLHRMPKGHAWFQLTAHALHLCYDGAADSRQQTTQTAPDAPTVAALVQHAGQLLPLLGKAVLEAPVVRVKAAYIMPDGLPLLGCLEQGSPLWLMGGMGVMDDMYAPALVEKLLELWRVEDYVESPLRPDRLVNMGPAASYGYPESLKFIEPLPAETPAAGEPQHLEATLAPAVEVKRATEVRMVGKEVITGANSSLRGRHEKSKLQTAALKG